jgi:hypothetical protein
MLRNEAKWLEDRLAELPSSALDPLLSLGSGGADFRDGKQPWIAGSVYAPLEARGIHVVHHEFAAGAGVDVAGDLGDRAFLDSLQSLGTRAVICCNVLEHLADRAPLLDAFSSLVAPGAALVLTVPRGFPYHADPIDTMYRPSVEELEAVLPGFELRTGAEVPCGTLWSYLRDAPDARTSLVKGLKTSLRRSQHPPATTTTERPAGPSAARYFLRQTSVTCAVFERSTPR